MGGYVAFSPIYACLALIQQPLRGDSIILDGHGIERITFGNSPFLSCQGWKTVRARCAPDPLGPRPPHPNRVKNTKRGYCAFIVHEPMYRGRGAGGKGPSRSSAPSPRADCPAPVVHGGTEGRVGQDYVSSELALPCARSGMDTPRGLRRYGVGRPRGAIRRRGLPHWQPHRE